MGFELTLDDVVYLAAVSLLAGFHIVTVQARLGLYRRKHGIKYPAMTGDDNFMRILRAQQNYFEWITTFLSFLWIAGIFFHQVAAAVVGLVYVVSREIFFQGYRRSVESRLPGFTLGFRCLIVLFFMGTLGVVTTVLRSRGSLDLALLFWQTVDQYLH